MLALSLKPDESATLKFGDLVAEVRIVQGFKSGRVKIAFDAPPEISIYRNTGKLVREENRERFKGKKQPAVYVAPEVAEKLKGKNEPETN